MLCAFGRVQVCERLIVTMHIQDIVGITGPAKQLGLMLVIQTGRLLAVGQLNDGAPDDSIVLLL